MCKKSLSIAFLLLSQPLAWAQAPSSQSDDSTITSPAVSADIQTIIAAGRSDNQVQEHLHHLTNRIGPRLTGSQGLQTACEWAKDHFTSLGLQNAQLEPWGEIPVGFDRGPAFGQMIEPKVMNLNFGTNSWTAGTRGVVAATAILAPKSIEDLEAAKPALKGKYVLLPRAARARRGLRSGRNSDATPNANPQNPANASSNTTPSEARPTSQNDQPPKTDPATTASTEEPKSDAPKLEEPNPEDIAKIREALAHCEVAGIIQPTMDDLILTGGSFQVDWNQLPTIPSINLQRSQWEEVAELLKNGEPVKLSFDIRNHFRKGPITLYNVFADLPGSEWPNEYVIVGGHIDSWDGATGATDNAAGCATTFEAARILAASGVKPKRTIRFMLWSGEEQGLLGSIGYVAKNQDLMERISAVLVHDGGTNYVSGIAGTEAMKPMFEQVFEPVKEMDVKAPFVIRVVDEILPRGGSDHVSFIQAGVPGFFWDQRGRATYRNTHHTQYDTYDSIVPEYQQHSSIIIAVGAYGIANLDTLLPRDNVRRGR